MQGTKLARNYRQHNALAFVQNSVSKGELNPPIFMIKIIHKRIYLLLLVGFYLAWLLPDLWRFQRTRSTLMISTLFCMLVTHWRR